MKAHEVRALLGSQELETAYERERCRRSFFYFVQKFWEVIIRENPVYNWHIPYLCEEMEAIAKIVVARQKKPHDLVINIPPGSTKSTITTIMFPAWIWVMDPTIRVITNSYSADLSIEHAIKSRDIIQSDEYKRLFPEVRLRIDKAAKSSYENTSTGARYTTSTGGTITGKHAHIIINDDPVNPAQALSTAMREGANEHTKTLSSRKVDKQNSITITIMQRLHEKDVTGYLLAKKGENIKHICLPAEVSDKVKPAELRDKYQDGLLDVKRMSREILQESRVDLGSRGYAGQFDQNPVAEGGNIIKKAWFPTMPAQEFHKRHNKEPIVFFIDTAYTSDAENDPSGILATCRIENTLYLIHGRKVYKKFPDLVRFIPDYVADKGYNSSSSIRIEPKANGLSVIDQLRELTSLNVVKTPSPMDDKEVRLNAASPTIEAGRVVIVEGDWADEFLEEVTGFPAKVHDEYVDLLCYATDYHLKKTIRRADPEKKKAIMNAIY